MGLTRISKRYFDDRLLWKTYMGWGRAATYSRLRAWCIQNGMVNPETGKVSQMGVYWAIWRFAVRNPEEAYEDYKLWQMEFGNFPTFQEFCIDLYLHAYAKKAIVIGKKKKKEFIEKYLKGIDLSKYNRMGSVGTWNAN